jgi:ribose/xylose/arabinose/galactoside ABC-type transport system permease subunit
MGMLGFRSKLKNAALTVAFPVVVWIIVDILCVVFQHRHVFKTLLDINNYVRNSGIAACIALALSFNLGNGRFDLSLGAQRIVATTCGGLLAIHLGLSGAFVIIFAVLFGFLGGALIGAIFVITRIPPMVLGVGMALVFECVAFAISNAQGLHLFGMPGMGGLSNMYLTIGVVAFATIFTLLVDRFTKFGYYTRAIAGSQKIARDSGINIFAHANGCYAFGGALIAISGVFDAAFKGSMDADMGMSSNASIMTNTFPMFLGRYIARWSSLPVGILFATLTVQIFKTGLSILQFSSTAQQVFNLGAFLLFLIFQANENLLKERSAKRARILEAKTERERLSTLYFNGAVSL